MKKIEAIIKPFAGRGRSPALAFRVLRSSRPRACRQKGHRTLPRRRICVDFLPKVKIEVIGEDMTNRVVDAIQQAAQTGRIGDGKIFISTVDEAIRIEPAAWYRRCLIELTDIILTI